MFSLNLNGIFVLTMF